MELSPREKQVAARLAAGLSNAEIAAELGIARRTVKMHVTNIALKNGMRTNRVLLARKYTETVQPLPSMPPKPAAIARLVIEGLKNSQIAAQLATSEQSVKNYLRIVYDAAGVWSRAELAARYRA